MPAPRFNMPERPRGVIIGGTPRSVEKNPQQEAESFQEMSERARKRLQDTAAVSLLSDALRIYAYERRGPFSLGGPNITAAPLFGYQVPTPFLTACEYRVVCVTFGGSGFALLSSNPRLTPLTATSTLAADANEISIPYAASAASGQPTDEEWYNLAINQQLYWLVAVAGGNAAWLTIEFRRRLDRHGSWDYEDAT